MGIIGLHFKFRMGVKFIVQIIIQSYEDNQKYMPLKIGTIYSRRSQIVVSLAKEQLRKNKKQLCSVIFKLSMKKSVQRRSMPQAFDIHHRFRNLQNPLKFIENERILALEDSYSQQKEDLRRQQEDKADFSKSIYKKVISRDNEYNFQHDLVSYTMEDSVAFNHKYSRTGQAHKLQQRTVKKEDLERRFKHGEIISMQEKRERLREEKEIPLTFKHVKLIDTPQFDQLKDVQFYGLIRGEQEKESHVSGNEISNGQVLTYLEGFKHKLLDESQYHSKTSYNFLLNCDRELKFWKLGKIFKDDRKSDDEVLANCAFMDTYNVSIYDMFDFSSRNIEINDIMKFYNLKKSLNAKMEMERNNESLEEKYNQAKKRFQEMKENRLKSKNQRLPAKFVSNVAQTNDDMKEKDFDDYFVQDANDIFDRLKQLNEIRDKIIRQEEGETFNVMATNVGLEITSELFKLLLVVLRGEDLSNYSQFIRADNQQEVQRKMLELIYLQFKNFKVLQVNGLSKVEIIKKYLYEREKNQRFYETYLIKKVENAPNTRPSITRTAVKPKKPVQTPTKQTATPTKQPASTPSKATKPFKAK